MTINLSPGLIDRPTAYGFTASMRLSELPNVLAWRRTEDRHVSEMTTHGLTVVVRHYPVTPESECEKLPLITANVVLAYEGRVDNREEIAHTLGMPQLSKQPDGAVLAAAYDAWGSALSAKTIGEYAYVVFDLRSRQLVAGQDSLGIRRIFYSAVGDRIIVTSNLSLLFERYPEVRPAYNRQVLREYFTGTMAPWSGRTIWRGIFELGRGNALVQRGAELEQKTVWQPDLDRRQRCKSHEEVDEVFRGHLFAAVRAALRSPAPLLCALSGGYDSSTVCSVAALLIRAGEARGPIIGWSYFNRRSNEIAFQDAVRRQYQIDDWHALDLTTHLPFQCFTDTEVPTGSFIQRGAIERATREFARAHGIRSLLTGQAADALLQKSGGGAPVYLSDWFREGRLRDWYRHFLAYLRGGSFNAWQLLRDCTLGTLDLHVGLRAPIPPWVTSSFRKEIAAARHDFLHLQPRVFRSDARERVYRWTLCFIPYPAPSPPEQRLPFAYRPLVEFLLGLEWDYLTRPNDERILMRRSLRQILPEIVWSGERCWTAFDASLYEGLRAAWPRIRHLVTGEQLADLGVVEQKPFKAAIEAMRAGYDGPNPQIAKTALYLETWLGLKAWLNQRLISSPALGDECTSSVTLSSPSVRSNDIVVETSPTNADGL
jgi:asparagine synthase (glutamine-hydrolysing)